MQPDAPPLAKGSIIAGRYRVQGELGSGGNGSVFRCITLDTPTTTTVAVKVLNPSAGNVELTRFARERDTMAAVSHPNVIKLLDYGTIPPTTPFIVLEFADGGSLEEHLRPTPNQQVGRILPVPEAAWILYQAASGLRAGRTVHRDLKPANLLLTNRPSTGKVSFRIGQLEDASLVKVADWGLAMDTRPLSERLTNSATIFGTPYYMSPEQCRDTKRLDVQSDLYSLGIIFFEMLTGSAPFQGHDPYEVIKSHCERAVLYPDNFPAAARPLAEMLLAKKAGDRPRSLLALQDLLVPLLGQKVGWSYAADSAIPNAPEPARRGFFGSLVVGVRTALGNLRSDRTGTDP